MKVFVPLLAAFALVAYASESPGTKPVGRDADADGTGVRRNGDSGTVNGDSHARGDSAYGHDSSYGNSHGKSSSYGNSHGESSSYGNSHGESSSYGNNHGHDSSYGNNHGESSSYGNNHGESSSYGNNHGESGSHGNDKYRPIGYGNNDYAPTGYGKDNYRPNGYGNNGHGHSSGYGHSGHGGRHGGVHRPTHFKAYIVHLPTRDGPPNELDELYARVGAVRDQVKTSEEQYKAIAARQAVQKVFFNRLVMLVLDELQNVDNNQDNKLDRIEALLYALENEVYDDLPDSVAAVNVQNQENVATQQSIVNLLANLEKTDILQSGLIGQLFSDVHDFKDRLDQIRSNEFKLFTDTVESAKARLKAVKASETRRICESGRVTLDADEGSVDYQYQSPFPTVPQLTIGLCGVNFDIDVVEDPFGFLKAIHNYQGGYGHGYGYGYTPPEDPNTMGVRVAAFSTPTGVRIEGFDLSVGDTKAVDVKVCFQACSIGPGTGPLIH